MAERQQPTSRKPDVRAERLKQALRNNLMRRKLQARERARPAAASSGGDSDSGGQAGR